MENLIGMKLGQYEIREKIGQGGMAQVFKAYQPGLDRFVAVKVLSPSLAEHPDFSERFQREAHSVARLNHPNILQVYDTGIESSYNFIVMRYVENSTTLDELIKAHVRIDQLIQYVIQVADALNYAHQQGIIHRDIKPGNILIDGKWALLADFGLVKISESSSDLTSTGLTMGTPAYMSPEQAAGKVVDHRTDIYALGIILYKILTGTVPHHAPTPLAIAVKRSTEPIPPLREHNPEISEDLERVILKSLEIKPENRYDSALLFAKDLQTIEFDQEGTIVNVDAKTKVVSKQLSVPREDATIASQAAIPIPDEKKGNNNALIGGAVVIMLILLALGWFAFSSGNSGKSTETPVAQNTTSSVAVNNDEDDKNEDVETPTSIPPTDTPAPVDTPVPGDPSAKALVEIDIYAGPGDIYDVIGGLPENASVEVIGRDKPGEWWQIKTPTGVGWITADSGSVEAENVNNILIVVAPNTPTPLATDTPTALPPTSTPEATDTPIPTPTSAIVNTPTPAPPTNTPTPELPTGQFVLLKPASLETDHSVGLTTFEWKWTSPLAKNQGFEVRVWLEGQPPAGVHDSVNDMKNGEIKVIGNNTYRLITDISDAPSVKGSGDYYWTVLLVEIDPAYKELGIQAPPNRLRYNAPGGGGGGGDGGGSGGGGGGLN